MHDKGVTMQDNIADADATHNTFLSFKIGDEVIISFGKDGESCKTRAIITSVDDNGIGFEPVTW